MQTQAEKSQQVNARMVEVMETLNSSIERVSAVIEENYSSTQEIERHTNETLEMIEMAAALSQENAASTEEISASTEEISAQVNEISHSAVLLAAIGEELLSSTARFKLG
jgi:methyl-accepting chemotaxis protein